MLQNNKNQTPLKFSFFIFSSSYIRHHLRWDVPHPCVSTQSRQHKAHVPWETDGQGKALDIKAHLALRRSSSVMVALEQLTTIQQEKRSQETTRGCLALAVPWVCSFLDLSRCCAIYRNSICIFLCLPRELLAPLALPGKAAQGRCRRTQAASPAPGPKALVAAPVSGGPAPTQQQGTAPSVFAWVTLNAFEMRCLNSLNGPTVVFFTASVYIQGWFTETRAHLYQNTRLLLTELPVARWNKDLISFLLCHVQHHKGNHRNFSHQWPRAERGFMAFGVR